MRVLVVDDEPLARRRLVRMLGRIEGALCVGEAQSAREALELVAALSPDVLLLDIDMPGMDGLALARALPENVRVIFTTAHREHAVAAFRLSALDYLLKPVVEGELVEALGRVPSARVVEPPRAVDTQALRLSARRGAAVALLDPARVTRFYAADKYVLCQIDGEEYVLDESLSELEAKLNMPAFVRVHRGELVNLERVRRVHGTALGTWLELDDGQRARVGRRALARVKAQLGIG